MIDNFELIGQFIDGAELAGGAFLFGQIICRGKDESEYTTKENTVVKDLVVRSRTDLIRQEKMIKALCSRLKARAYVNLTPRSFEQVTIEMAGLCLDNLRNRSFLSAKSIFATVCGKIKAGGQMWIVDVDDMSQFDDVVRHTQAHEVLRVPTPNGMHIITNGFDARVLREEFPLLDVHKNNPTLLFYPA